LAPHLGAVLGSPGGFPFFSHPLRKAVECSFEAIFSIFRGRSLTVTTNLSNNCLTAVTDIYVPHNHLADFSSVAVQSLHLRRESSQQFRGVIDIGIDSIWRLTFP
jgi:hypothetical protein